MDSSAFLSVAVGKAACGGNLGSWLKQVNGQVAIWFTKQPKDESGTRVDYSIGRLRCVISWTNTKGGDKWVELIKIYPSLMGKHSRSRAFHRGSASPSQKRGIVLPVVLGLVMLVVLSALMISSFGSNTRKLLLGAQGANLCRHAAEGAIIEARAFCQSQVNMAPDDWEPFFKGLVPGNQMEPAQLEFFPSVAAKSAKRLGVTLTKVTIKRLHVTTTFSRAQGLLSFSVEASWKGVGGLTRKVKRDSLHRFFPKRVTRRKVGDTAPPKPRLHVFFRPEHLCVGEEGASK